MSALSYLCGYGSSSEESDSEPVAKTCQRSKLPAPNLSNVLVVPTEVHEDEPQLHSGRTRSFPHIRGNWATFVYVEYKASDAISELINELEKIVLTIEESCQRCSDLHLSLSRTIVLKYHMISSFSVSLQEALRDCESFDLGFSEVKIFCNEEKSRTFIALQVGLFSHKCLLTISKKIDLVFTDFALPTFYENPSFHMSIFWVNGNKKTELKRILDCLNDILIKHFEKSGNIVLVDKIICKSGNKHFQYPLL